MAPAITAVRILLAAAGLVGAVALRLPAGAAKPVNASAGPTVLAAQTSSGNATAAAGRQRGPPPCACEASNPNWKTPAPRAPACLFFDLGAADGETYKAFLHKSSKWDFEYNTGGFPKESCYAYLIEANPRFVPQLEPLRNSRVYPMPQTAAYMCDKPVENFWLDTGTGGAGGWGSALNSSHEAVKTGMQAVPVTMSNLNRLLVENALPGDTVVVKMDIEGAEYDILPCLAKSPAATLVDHLYVEDHCPGNWWCPSTGQAGNTKQVFEMSKTKLMRLGVDIPPQYWSPML